MANNVMEMDERVCLITGAGGLLGIEHARALLRLNASIVITDVSQHICKKTYEILHDEYPNASISFHVMDVKSETSVKDCLDAVLEIYGKIDVLINNAAVNPSIQNDSIVETSRFEHFDLLEWKHHIDVGLTGAFLCAKYFAQHMAENNGGVILNIASDLAVIAPDQRLYRKAGLADKSQPVKPVTYSVVKTGLIGLTRYLATYYHEDNVRVNALSPGGVFDGQGEEFVKRLTDLIPLGRMASKDEYHGAIQFLCSDASKYMTGQNIVMDGGRSVW